MKPTVFNVDIERLINRHKDAVYKQMVRACGNHEDAEDALADALFAALKSSEQLRDPIYFQAWLSKIGTRACARMRIRERLVQFTSLSDLEAKGFELSDNQLDPAKQSELLTLKDCVMGAIESLPEIYRDVYLRREITGETAEDVSAYLNLSIPAIKSRLHRARQMVRESLDSGMGCRSLADSAA